MYVDMTRDIVTNYSQMVIWKGRGSNGNSLRTG